MSNYRFKATGLIAEAFIQHDVKFKVDDVFMFETVSAGFSVDCGPLAEVRFINADNDNDVHIRVLGLISNTPKEKRGRMLEACNIINRKISHIKFVLDPKGSVHVEYDFPLRSSDDSVGEMAFELFVRIMKCLDDEYKLFMKALYTDDDLEEGDNSDHSSTEIAPALREQIEKLRKMIDARIASLAAEPTDDSSEPEDDPDLK